MTAKQTQDVVSEANRIGNGVIARRPQADVAIYENEIATAAAQPRNDKIKAPPSFPRRRESRQRSHVP
jgi:hypothetical protein